MSRIHTFDHFFGAKRAAISLAATAVFFGVAGCGLVKVNGKPLFASKQSESATAPEAASPDANRNAASSAHAGAARPVSALAAAWCEDRSGNGGSLADLESALAEKELEYAAQSLSYAVCGDEGEAVERPERTAAIAKAWMDKHHLDVRDVSVLLGRTEPMQPLEGFSGPIAEYVKLTDGPLQRMAGLDQIGVGASNLARVALVRQCFDLGLAPYSKKKSYPLLLMILCTQAPIDLARAEAEIDGSAGINDTTRYYFRRETWRAVEAIRMAKEVLAKASKDDPGVERLVAIADEEYLAWTAPSPRRVKAIELLEQMEAATASNKRSALAGCEEKTVKAWSDAISGKKLPDAPNKQQLATYLDATLTSAEAYLAFKALRLCSAATEGRGTKLAYEVVPDAKVRRGPISATIAGWIAAEKPIEFDERDRSLGGLLLEIGGWGSDGYQGDVKSGTISRIAEVPGGVEVSFKTVKEQGMACLRWVKTGRIRAIEANGTVSYEERCAATGKVMFDQTSAPVKFGKAMARGLAPGMFLHAIDGLPIVATRSASSGTPIFVLGGMLR